MTNEEKYHTCGTCEWENTYICPQCKWGEDIREDLWKPKKDTEEEGEE